jgi:hypothetical protein
MIKQYVCHEMTTYFRFATDMVQKLRYRVFEQEQVSLRHSQHVTNMDTNKMQILSIMVR